jgi:hypothetical protein
MIWPSTSQVWASSLRPSSCFSSSAGACGTSSSVLALCSEVAPYFTSTMPLSDQTHDHPAALVVEHLVNRTRSRRSRRNRQPYTGHDP